MKRSIVALMLAASLVAGCGQKSGQGKMAAGGSEVLPGSVSDAMLDLDRSKAEAPLMAPAPDSTGLSASLRHAAADASASDAPQPDAAPTPEESAKATPSVTKPSE